MDGSNSNRGRREGTNIESHWDLHTIAPEFLQPISDVILNIPPEDIRIEIHNMPSSDQNQQDYLASTMQNNLSSLFNQARSQSDPRRWEMNFRSVMQGLLPRNENDETRNNSSSQQIPRNEPPDLENGVPQQPPINLGRNLLNVMQSNRPSFNEIGIPPERPIHDRVAALTRDDPPYLLDSPNTEQNRRQDGGNNSNQDVFNSLAEHFIEVQLSYRNLTGCLPFISLIILKAVYDNFGSLLYATTYASALFLFMYANKVVCKQTMLFRDKEVFVVFRTQILIFIWWCLLTFPFPDDYGLLIIAPLPENIPLSELLCRTFYADILIKMLTVLIKMSIIVLPNHAIPYCRRGRVFTFLESFSQLYRSLAPIQTWLIYSYNYYRDWERFVGVFFTVSYITFKCCNLFSQLKFFGKSLIGLFRNRNIGLPATKEDLDNSGGLCPICHENFNSPVKLDCKHVFCETCVGTWFSKQLTCPLCRAKVKEDLCWASGATAVHVQFY